MDDKSKINELLSKINPWKAIAIVVTLVLMVILIFIAKGKELDWSDIVLPIIYSIIAGLIVSVTSDTLTIIDTIITKMSKSTSDMLMSNGFLEDLSPSKLSQISDDAIRLKYSASQKENTGAILDISKTVCGLLNEPFYRSYAEDITIKNNRKTTVTSYEIVNNTGKETIVDVGIRKLSPDENLTNISLFNLNSFCIQIDSSQKVEISKFVQIALKSANEEKDINKKSFERVFRCYVDGILSRHNLQEFGATGTGAENPTKTEDGIKIRFSDRITVSFELEQPFTECDLSYARNLRYLAKNYSIKSNCPDNYSLCGAIIGPFVQKNKNYSVTRIKNSGGIIIQCNDWLLPGIGAVLTYNKKV